MGVGIGWHRHVSSFTQYGVVCTMCMCGVGVGLAMFMMLLVGWLVGYFIVGNVNVWHYFLNCRLVGGQLYLTNKNQA